MQQTLQLNIIPFKSPVKEITLPFSIGKQQGFYGLYLDDEVKELVGDKMSKLEYLENKRIYTNFGTPKENSFLLPIDIEKHLATLQNYINQTLSIDKSKKNSIWKQGNYF